MASNIQDIDQILRATFTSIVGKETKVFFAHGIDGRYNCQCCHTNNMDITSVFTHANGKKHKLVLNELNSRPKALLHRRDEISPDDAENSSPLQNRINEIKNKTIIGLEYVIELHLGSNFECVYHCVLCESKFNPTTVISHLTTYNHRLQYLEKHFPTAFKEISDLDTNKRELKLNLTEKVCEGIEDQYGRLHLHMVDNTEFAKDRMQTTEMVLKSKHIDEYMGSTFVDLIRDCLRKEQNLSDISDIEEEEIRSPRASLDSISDSSESYRSLSVISLSSNSPSLSSDSMELSILYNSNAMIAHSQHVQQQTYQMEKFRLLMANAESDLKIKYEGYKDRPLTHSGYKEEWDTFWKRRYKELRSAGQSVDNHDFKSEWGVEWKLLMERRLESDIESRSREIRQQLGIQDPNLDEKDKIVKKIQVMSKKKKSKSEKRSSKKKKDRRSTRRSTSSNRRILRSSEKHRQSTLRSRSPQRHRRSPQRSRSPRRHRRSPRSSRSPRTRHSPRSHQLTRRSRSPTRYDRPKPRSIRRSSTPHRSRSPRHLTRRSPSYSHQRTTRQSRSPYRLNETRRLHLSPARSFEIKPSLKLLTAEQDERMIPWKRPGGGSMSPQKSNTIVSSTHTGKPILARRNTLHFATKPSQENPKLCAPVPPRLLSITSRPPNDTNVNGQSEPLTVILVLRLLTALEDILGSLGPKVIQLMIQAKEMDKAEKNSSSQLLDDHDNCILFETIKEKLKGLSSALLVEPNKINAVKKAIKNMETLIHQNNEREKACDKLQGVGVRRSFPRTDHQQRTVPRQLQLTQPDTSTPLVKFQTTEHRTPTSLAANEEERRMIKAKLSVALIGQGKMDVTDEQMDDLVECYFKEVTKKKLEMEKAKNNANSTQSNGVVVSTVPIRSKSPFKVAANLEAVPLSTGSDPSSSCRLVDVFTNRPSTSYQRAILPKPVVSHITAPKPDSKLSYQNVPVAKPVPMSTPVAKNVPISTPVVNPIPMSTFQYTPIAKPISKIHPSAETEDEVFTLKDSELLTLMNQFASLSDREKENYTAYMKQLEVDNPVRFKRLHNENRKPQINRSKTSNSPLEATNATDCRKITNRTDAQKIYSPGDYIIDDDERATTHHQIVIDSDSDSDSDDSAILASSIANTQQQIAQINGNLNPMKTGEKIPLISSVQTLVTIGKVQPPRNRNKTVTSSGQQVTFGNSSTTPARTLPPSLPALPPIQYPPQQRLYPNNIFPPPPQQQQQQQPYQQYPYPIPQPHPVMPPFRGFYQQSVYPHPPYYLPR